MSLVSSPSERTSALGGALPVIVSEVFSAWQGEGPSAGERAVFVRTGGCNLACSWCDTPYTWDWAGRNGVRFDPRTELTSLPADDLVSLVLSDDAHLVVFTGGEPLLQQNRLAPVAAAVRQCGRRIEVETNGTVLPIPPFDAQIAQYVVSPKLASSGNDSARARVLPSLRAFATDPRAAFKFVCVGPDDLVEVERLATMLDLPTHRVWIMPEGRSADAVLDGARALLDGGATRGYHLSLRQHVLLFGDRRGV